MFSSDLSQATTTPYKLMAPPSSHWCIFLVLLTSPRPICCEPTPPPPLFLVPLTPWPWVFNREITRLRLVCSTTRVKPGIGLQCHWSQIRSPVVHFNPIHYDQKAKADPRSQLPNESGPYPGYSQHCVFRGLVDLCSESYWALIMLFFVKGEVTRSLVSMEIYWVF